MWLLPVPVSDPAHHLLAVFVAVVFLWVTEVLPVGATALMIAPLMILSGVTDAKSAFEPYAHPLLYLFVGGFMIARAMARHGLDRRIALSLVSIPWLGSSPARVRMAFMATGLLLSMWISNVATTAILVPILLGLIGDETSEGPGPVLSGGVLSLAYACSVGGLGTPVGSPPNLIAMTALQESGFEFTFLDWVKIGLPTSILMIGMMYLVLQWMSPPPAIRAGVSQSSKHLTHGTAEPQVKGVGPWSRGERVTAVSFGLAVVGWIAPGILVALEAPAAQWFEQYLPPAAVAMFAVAVLFAVPAHRPTKSLASSSAGKLPVPRVLPWSDAARIDWGVVVLFGGGMALGKQMFETGLAAYLGEGFVELTGVRDLWPLTFAVIFFTIFFTETCSNTATSNMLAPIVVGVATTLGVSPIPPVIGMALAASCAFMLPIATGPNAIVFGTGLVDSRQMMRIGLVLNLVCGVAIFIAMRLLSPLYGWA